MRSRRAARARRPPRPADDGPDETARAPRDQDHGAAQEVRADRHQVVLEREPDRTVVGRAVEPALRQHRVNAHQRRERDREHVRRVDPERKPSGPKRRRARRARARRRAGSPSTPGWRSERFREPRRRRARPSPRCGRPARRSTRTARAPAVARRAPRRAPARVHRQPPRPLKPSGDSKPGGDATASPPALMNCYSPHGCMGPSPFRRLGVMLS